MKDVYRNVKKTIKKDKNHKSEIDSKVYLASNKPKGRQAFQNYLVRRGAHAFEYCVLAILISNAFYQFKVKGKRAFIYIIFFCLFTAVLDEFYQSFVPGRTSAVADVLLDFTGSIFGTFLSYVSFYRKKLS